MPEAGLSAKVLFGGTYLFCFGVGIVLKKLSFSISKVSHLVIGITILLFSAPFLSYISNFGGVANLRSISFIVLIGNPPGILCIIYTIGILLVFGFIFNRFPVKSLEVMGKYSMQIYLYHWLFYVTVIPNVCSVFRFNAQVLPFFVQVLLFLSGILIPLGGKIMYDKIKQLLQSYMQDGF